MKESKEYLREDILRQIRTGIVLINNIIAIGVIYAWAYTIVGAWQYITG